jgi:hypothetical protein
MRRSESAPNRYYCRHRRPPTSAGYAGCFLLPGGNRAAGLAQMEEASRSGVLVRAEADVSTSHRLTSGTSGASWTRSRSSRGLHARYPRNPLFHQIEAEILDVYVHDAAASLAASEALVAEADRGAVNPSRADAGAR